MKWIKRIAIIGSCLALAGCATAAAVTSGPSPGAATGQRQFVALADAGAPARLVGIEAAGLQTIVLRYALREGVSRWVGPSGAGLYFRNGVLVATRGLGAGLLAADASQTQSLVQRGQPGRAQRFHSYLTGDNQRVTRTYECIITRDGTESVLLGDGRTTQAMIRMTEDCTGLSDRFINHYWVTPGGGRVLRSRQWTGSRVGMVSFVDVPAGTDLNRLFGGA